MPDIKEMAMHSLMKSLLRAFPEAHSKDARFFLEQVAGISSRAQAPPKR